jgi:hypothetical protein
LFTAFTVCSLQAWRFGFSRLQTGGFWLPSLQWPESSALSTRLSAGSPLISRGAGLLCDALNPNSLAPDSGGSGLASDSTTEDGARGAGVGWLAAWKTLRGTTSQQATSGLTLVAVCGARTGFVASQQRERVFLAPRHPWPQLLYQVNALGHTGTRRNRWVGTGCCGRGWRIAPRRRTGSNHRRVTRG